MESSIQHQRLSPQVTSKPLITGVQALRIYLTRKNISLDSSFTFFLNSVMKDFIKFLPVK